MMSLMKLISLKLLKHVNDFQRVRLGLNESFQHLRFLIMELISNFKKQTSATMLLSVLLVAPTAFSKTTSQIASSKTSKATTTTPAKNVEDQLIYQSLDSGYLSLVEQQLEATNLLNFIPLLSARMKSCLNINQQSLSGTSTITYSVGLTCHPPTGSQKKWSCRYVTQCDLQSPYVETPQQWE
jgi:hypothetical protein